jgi:hypothetical protein
MCPLDKGASFGLRIEDWVFWITWANLVECLATEPRTAQTWTRNCVLTIRESETRLPPTKPTVENFYPKGSPMALLELHFWF